MELSSNKTSVGWVIWDRQQQATDAGLGADLPGELARSQVRIADQMREDAGPAGTRSGYLAGHCVPLSRPRTPAPPAGRPDGTWPT
jgi:hypothetical protein